MEACVPAPLSPFPVPVCRLPGESEPKRVMPIDEGTEQGYACRILLSGWAAILRTFRVRGQLRMARRNSGTLASVVSVPFVLCVLVLSAAALGRVALVRYGDVITRKAPVPLRKPLGALDISRLGDYERIKVNTLSAAVEAQLGTEQYLDWVLVDKSVSRSGDPRRYVFLSVTYYTGGPNLAPHTPDVCRQGAGYQPKQPHENRVVEVPALGAEGREVPIRVCTFVKTPIFGREEPTVVYTFHANGKFTTTRTGVRRLTHRITDRHAYYSKVEVSFGGGPGQSQNLGRQESIAAAAKLFNTILPILIEEHWPDWEAVESPQPDEQG